MKKSSLFLLVYLASFSPSLMAMKRSSEPNSPTKRGQEDLELIDLTNLCLQSPSKKSKPSIQRSVARTLWQEQMVPDHQLPLLYPIEETHMVDLEVDPVVHAVYYDNVEMLKKILDTQSINLSQQYINLLEKNTAATLLDIAVDQCAYSCLELFITLLEAPPREFSLQEAAVRALENKDDAITLLDAQTVDRYAQAQSLNVSRHIVPQISILYRISQQSALRIARKKNDMRSQTLLKDALRIINL